MSGESWLLEKGQLQLGLRCCDPRAVGAPYRDSSAAPARRAGGDASAAVLARGAARGAARDGRREPASGRTSSSTHMACRRR